MADGEFARTAMNRFGWSYAERASALGPPPVTILDAHAHINGARACAIWARAADAFGIGRVYSMTRVGEAENVRGVLGDRVRFIAFPDWSASDREGVHRAGYLRVIDEWRARFGAGIVKLWNAPSLRDFAGGDASDVAMLDSPWRVRHAERAQELGMMLMAHVADPDTWFRTRYADASRYGRKRDHHDAFERMLDRFPGPWIGAHMGGSPEDLGFLDGLLSRHPNLFLDTSATKWVVRELSRHPRERVAGFFDRWRGRLLFGSDIVTMDAHLSPDKSGAPGVKADQAASPEEAFDLYASRYWALRAMFETGYEGESPIADPDLAMVEPSRFDAMSAPMLRGQRLGREVLTDLYAGAAGALLESRAARSG